MKISLSGGFFEAGADFDYPAPRAFRQEEKPAGPRLL